MEKTVGMLLDNFRSDVMRKVDTFIKLFLARISKTAHVPGGWEKLNREHVVHVFAVLGKITVFLDSVSVGSVNQTAVSQVALEKSGLNPCGGVYSFAAVASGNALVYIKMSQISSDSNTGIVSLNDESHVIDPSYFGYIWEQSCEGKLGESVAEVKYVHSHQYLQAQFQELKMTYNAALRQAKKDKSTETVIKFTSISRTRFSYSLDILSDAFATTKLCPFG